MTIEDRGLVHWALSSLMVAEERITTKFAGLVLAHGSEEEATFLATQQVDEAPAAKGALVPRGPGAAARVRRGLRRHPP
jgi:hypothetical protein